jgi:transposase
MTITGVNPTVATGLMAAIGDISRFDSPGKLVSYLGLNPRGAAIRTRRRSSWRQGWARPRARYARRSGLGMAKAAGPCVPSSFASARRRGHHIAAVAVARKLAVLCWHVFQRPGILVGAAAFVANKTRATELQAGKPQKKGGGQPTLTTSSCEIRSSNWPSRQDAIAPASSTLENASTEGQGARAPQSGKGRIVRRQCRSVPTTSLS